MKQTDKEFFDKNPSGSLDDLPKDIKEKFDAIFNRILEIHKDNTK